jgi:hypothetical protein
MCRATIFAANAASVRLYLFIGVDRFFMEILKFLKIGDREFRANFGRKMEILANIRTLLARGGGVWSPAFVF